MSTRMTLEGIGEDGVCRYVATLVPVVSGRVGYVVRILPGHPDLHNPLDTGLVYWA